MGQYSIDAPKTQEDSYCKDNKKQQSATRPIWQQKQEADKMARRAAAGLEPDLEAVKDGLYVDKRTGEAVEALRDDKYDWRQKKQKTVAVATLYRAGHDDKYADRAMSCSTWLQYWASASGDRRTLQAFNACHLRMCPLCANRRAKQMLARLLKILKAVKADHPTATLLFLTLTVRNCDGAELRDTLTLLTAAWHKLVRRRPVQRAIMGWFRAIEITRNRIDGTYHPHIHAILIVEPGYFKKGGGLYIPHSRAVGGVPDDYKGPFWVDMWGECLKVDYKPSVRISKAKGKSGEQRDTDAASLNAALEAAKYATKDTEYINGSIPEAERADVLRVYTDALRGKRLVALGGWMADAAGDVDLEEDGDLVHGDEDSDEALTAATAEVLEIYGWHFKAAEHVLKARVPNPDYQGPGGQGGSGNG